MTDAAPGDPLPLAGDMNSFAVGVLDLVEGAIVLTDADDEIKFWNATAEATYGWRRSEAIGQKVHELLDTVFLTPWMRSTVRWNAMGTGTAT